MENVSLVGVISLVNAVNSVLPKLSESQRNVLLSIGIHGYTDAKDYMPNTLVSLCRLGLSTLHDNGHMRLSPKGRVTARALEDALNAKLGSYRG